MSNSNTFEYSADSIDSEAQASPVDVDCRVKTVAVRFAFRAGGTIVTRVERGPLARRKGRPADRPRPRSQPYMEMCVRAFEVHIVGRCLLGVAAGSRASPHPRCPVHVSSISHVHVCQSRPGRVLDARLRAKAGHDHRPRPRVDAQAAMRHIAREDQCNSLGRSDLDRRRRQGVGP